MSGKQIVAPTEAQTLKCNRLVGESLEPRPVGTTLELGGRVAARAASLRRALRAFSEQEDDLGLSLNLSARGEGHSSCGALTVDYAR